MAFLLVLVDVLEYSKVCRLGLSRQGGFAWSPSGGLFVVRRVDVASRQRKQQENSVVVLYTVSGSKGCVGFMSQDTLPSPLAIRSLTKYTTPYSIVY